MPIKRVLRIFRYRGLNPLHTFNKEATVTGRFLVTGPDAIRKQGMLRIYGRAGFAFIRARPFRQVDRDFPKKTDHLSLFNESSLPLCF